MALKSIFRSVLRNIRFIAGTSVTLASAYGIMWSVCAADTLGFFALMTFFFSILAARLGVSLFVKALVRREPWAKAAYCFIRDSYESAE